jgi:hypothetical protein
MSSLLADRPEVEDFEGGQIPAELRSRGQDQRQVKPGVVLGVLDRIEPGVRVVGHGIKERDAPPRVDGRLGPEKPLQQLGVGQPADRPRPEESLKLPQDGTESYSRHDPGASPHFTARLLPQV